jgi:multiple sugar transport system substrate-binding protein
MRPRPISALSIKWLGLFLLFSALPLEMGGCTPEGRAPAGKGSGITLVFKHGRIEGNPALFRRLIERFEAERPEIRVVDEPLPSSSDQQHQYYAINLEGHSREFDLMALDVIWVPEFSRAGWIREVPDLLPEAARGDFFPSTVEAATFEGKPYAVPWYIDAGLLYYRKDLLEKYGLPPPRHWDELVEDAKRVIEKENDPRLFGFVWQGKQYEGLVCDALEFIWSRGGGVVRDGKVILESAAAEEALRFMRGLLTVYGVSPALVTTADEEATRRLFGEGRAVFMRNWPYAWNLFQSAGSGVRGKVGIAPLPSFPGHPSAAALGGWYLAINRYSRHPEAAEALIRYLTSPEIQKALAIGIGYKPTRMSLYRDAALKARQPFISSLERIFLTARPRPVTPYYLMFSQVMQPEFSAAVTGIKSPAEALRSAKLQMEHILK